MRIVKLEAENFKKLRAVEITPAGAIVEIRGQNGAGKTSVLDAIAAAIGGEKLCPEVPIRRGQQRAQVLVELDDGMIVERRWTVGGGSRLEVRSKDGLRYPSPQKLLDGLVGRLSFDPLAFLRVEPREQAATLQRLAGVDLRLLDEKRRRAYDARTEANRQVAQLRARLAPMPAIEVTPDCPAEPVSSADLLAEQGRRQELQRANDVERAALEVARGVFRADKQALEQARAEVERARAALAAAEKREAAAAEALRQRADHGSTLQAKVAELVDPDLEEIPAKLRTVESVNDLVRRRKARADLAADLGQAELEAKDLDDEVADVDRQKAEVLAAAKFPVPGLGFTDAGVTLDGLPLEQASSAEQLRVSLAMGIGLNPKLKVLLIRDGSLLDEKSLALVAEMAEEAGAQVWLEIVGKGGVGVVIEDGQVDGAPAAAEVAHG
jgi:hypothetical protein